MSKLFTDAFFAKKIEKETKIEQKKQNYKQSLQKIGMTHEEAKELGMTPQDVINSAGFVATVQMERIAQKDTLDTAYLS